MQTIDRRELRQSWVQYLSNLPPDGRADRAAFTPDPRQILSRASTIQWLRLTGLDDFALSILVEESLSIDLVRRLVARFGTDRARTILLSLID